MVRYAVRRLLLVVPVVLGAAAVAFALLLLLPGDPAVALLGQEASGAELARFRHLLGLDRPVPIQLGLLPILLCAVKLNWLPSFGRGAPFLSSVITADLPALADSIRHLFLPACTLAFFNLALLSRLTRWALLEVLEEDYVRTARAKGQRERIVLYRHALRNALLPIVTIVGLQFGNALGGAVVTETIYGWPGMGRLVVQAIGQRDLPVVPGAVLVLALIFSLVKLVVDLTYALIDPRIRYE